MAQKNATPSKVRREIMERNKLTPLFWAVHEDMDLYLIVRHRITGEFKHIEKGGGDHGNHT